MKFAFVFPGQGSQSVGMLGGFEGNAAVDAVLARASEALGQDMRALIAQGPAESLNLTINTQPAMLLAGYACYTAWREAGGPQAACMAGHSLGEYTALSAAGALRLEDALTLVRFRAEAMQDAVPVGVGAMAAILGLSDTDVRAACEQAAGSEVVEPVNFNAPSQVVIAGHRAAVERACAAAKERGAKRAVLLPVSAPFHSSLLAPAAQRLAQHLESVQIVSPQVPVINNIDVQMESEPARIRSALARQAAGPVRWVDTIRAMADAQVTHVLECGPGKVLAGLTRRIAPELESMSIYDEASVQDALSKLKGSEA